MAMVSDDERATGYKGDRVWHRICIRYMTTPY